MRKHLLLISISLFIFQCFSFGQGSTYTGTYTQSARIEYSNKSNFVIEGLEIGNTTNHCITLWNCSNVTIRNCKFGPSVAVLGVYLSGCSNVTITNCTFENLSSGMIASLCTGNIKFEYNDVKNILGPSKGGASSWGQMVQFIRVTGAGNSVSYNACENVAGQSAPEDIININDGSSGTADSPIRIANNWIRGGGPSNSGGGICLGDVGGSYCLVENNILIDPGQYGIGVAGGHDHVIRNNKVYGRQQAFTNVGISAWNQYTSVSATYGITISNNEVNFTNKDGVLNNWWIADNVGTIAGMSTTVYNANLKASILPSTIIARAKGVTTDINTGPVVNYKIFPNPVFSSSIVVTIDTPNNETVSISNLKGLSMIQKSISDTRTEIDTSGLTAGIYVVKISNSVGVIETRRIVVSRS